MGKLLGRARRPSIWVVGCALGAAALGCSDSAAPPTVAPIRDCPRALWARPSEPGADIRVVGSWNDWQEPGASLNLRADGWYTNRVPVPEGEYGYLISENGQKRIDVYNPLTTFRGKDEVSLLRVPACSVPEIHVDEVATPEGAASSADGTATIRATFFRGQTAAELAPASVMVLNDASAPAGTPPPSVTVQKADPASGALVVALSGLPRGNNVVRLVAADREGRRVEQAVSVWIAPRARTWADGVVYEIFTDRFRAEGGRVLSPPSSPGMRAGGTLDGVRAELEKGTFEALGVTALWLSPPATTPDEPRIGLSGRLEDAYHGYWQLDTRTVDPRLGGDNALDRLVEAAHRRGIRILIDIVPNHVYERHPRYLLHRDDGWFHQGADKCVCGDDACSWATDIEHCWFAGFLPDYRFEDADVMRETADDAAYWMTRFHVDGVRVDAVPMMPRAATRRIVDALRRAVAPDAASFSLGEVFTGTDGLGEIRYYLGPDGLSSAFDFPLMWTMREAVASDRAGFTDVDTVLQQGQKALQDSPNLLARMIDNHDTSRFLSEAAGNGDNDAWNDPPPDPETDAPYQRLELGLALLFTLPGVPVLYYGDELGMAGASDPDSRRVMPDLSRLSARQGGVMDVARKLGTLRANVEALRSGLQRTLAADRNTYAFTRTTASGGAALVVASKSAAPVTIALPPDSLAEGAYVEAFDGTALEIRSGVGTAVPVAPLSFRVFVHPPNLGAH